MNNRLNWRVQRSVNRTDKPDGDLEIVAKNGMVICELPGRPTPDMNQHAYLIAAAPQLLEAVATAINMLEDDKSLAPLTELLRNAYIRACLVVDDE